MSTQAHGQEYYIGLMSGTSVDAIDCACIEATGNQVRFHDAISFPIPPSLTRNIHQLCTQGQSAQLQLLSETDVALGRLMAEAVLSLLKKTRLDKKNIIAIGSHGQTVFHHPHGDHPYTLQIGDPNIIAEKTGITTVADFRRRDIAAGGEGAPLVPLFHYHAFRSDTENRVIVNIGGIANITILPADRHLPVSGFDTGPGNTLMDQWISQEQGKPMDTLGEFAASGKPDNRLLDKLLQDPYFQRHPPKSCGREYFNPEWLATFLKHQQIPSANVQATLCQLTAISIMNAIRHHAPDTKTIFICGGGSHNPVLMSALRKQAAGIPVEDTRYLGIDPDWVEAITFAWLAKMTLQNKPGNLPSVTGAHSNTVLGGIYPGNSTDSPVT